MEYLKCFSPGLLAFALTCFTLTVRAEDKLSPVPSGPQADGPFRKVILEADRDLDGDGKIDDALVDVMELAVAPDGRVFYAERAGIIKVWGAETKSSVVIGHVPVFTGLEGGLLGITLDPLFAKNGWIYFFYSEPETYQDDNGQKRGTESRFPFHARW